jgi:DMSO/TMAO reductase YedYZ molybdopterin-dependent catalytic subunit
MNDTQVERLNRRQFLIKVGAASAVITVAGAGVSALIGGNQSETAPIPEAEPIAGATDEAQVVDALPNAGDPVQPAPGTRPEYTPVAQHYRIDIAALPPSLDEATWVLPISGLVENELELTLDDLRNNYTPFSQYITMSCISNRVAGDLISTTLWTGASFRDVLADANLAEDATHIKISSADGFDETVALADIMDDETVILCYAWDNEPLTERNGFPIRIHLPNRYGMKQPKWITNMEVLGQDEDGYWVRRGWSKDAFVRATSVVDTVATDMMIIDEDTEETRIPVGGIAWAGPRRVSKVEVQVNDGDWVEAQLRAPLNNDLEDYRTWVVWRYDWLFEEGSHTFRVRMVDGNGDAQIEEVNGVRPDGATGIHDMDATL